MEATELFSICGQLAAEQPSTGGLRRMHQLLVLCCGSVEGMAFGNLFSQIDWLCKRLGMKTADTIAIQTARRHSNQTEPPSAEDWLYDLRAVALFISAVLGADVPGHLLRLLPAANKPHEPRRAANRRHARCIVSHTDATTIWADTDDGPVIVDYAEHQYLARILRPGMQIGLLDVVQDTTADGLHLRPAIIIVEPDFLVDISSLAACFTPYGHHPLIYTLNRLKPRANTQAMLLGNFAGAALDALVHNSQATTAAVLRRSFREQALRFCACQDFDAAKFKLQAEQQMQNTREAVAVLSPLTPYPSPPTSHPSPLLEPSFICERLGLQGRVDLMTTDMSLLVEQKSGRNLKIERRSHDSHGLQQESHYVQLLLYYGILRYNFERSDRQVDTRLLYSRYPPGHGLLTVNYYRTLFREALRLRNQIVATDLLIAREGFGRIMPLLRADVIYKEVEHDGGYHRFVEPEMTALAALYASLTPVERAYYTTMLTFVYREQAVQKIGSAQTALHHSGGCSADLWQMPLSEKTATGNIYTALQIEKSEKTNADGGYDLITLRRQDAAESPVSNFRVGDMVYLYRYDDKPDVRSSILYKGTLAQMADERLTVKLSDGQQSEQVFAADSGATWAIEHGGSDTAANSALRALQQFIGSDAQRRQLLLGQRAPSADTSLGLSRSYNPAYDDIVLRQKQARDYFLLQGPPGTGKTSMALRFMVQEELVCSPSAPAPRPSVLLTAYTKRAVDEICAMLDDAGTDYMRIVGDEVTGGGTLDELRWRIGATPVVVGTTSMLQAHPFVLQVKHFSLCIVDEASQILEPSIIGLLSADSIDRFVLVGDHKQLPAVVQQSEADARVSDPLLRSIGITDCRQSLFERLLRWERRQGRTQFTGVLSRQGRMHPAVAQFPTAHFYRREQLGVVPCPHQLETTLSYAPSDADALGCLLASHRMLFLPVVPAELPRNDQSNVAEADVVAQVVERIARFYGDRFDPRQTLGIIVPYRSQIAAIRQALSSLVTMDSHTKTACSELSIDTVERYQGSQRDVIVYSTTVSRRYQLDFLAQSTIIEPDDEASSPGLPIDRKFNVALTRARRQMIVVGNPAVLSHNPLFRQFIADYSVDAITTEK